MTRGPMTLAYERNNLKQLRDAIDDNPVYLQQCGSSLVIRAIEDNCFEALLLLLEKGVMLDSVRLYRNRCPIQLADRLGRSEMLQLLHLFDEAGIRSK